MHHVRWWALWLEQGSKRKEIRNEVGDDMAIYILID